MGKKKKTSDLFSQKADSQVVMRLLSLPFFLVFKKRKKNTHNTHTHKGYYCSNFLFTESNLKLVDIKR